MRDGFELDSYLLRIGYTGDTRATIDTLAGIQLAHAQAIVFENLDPLLGRTVDLGVAALQDKIVARRRGGYCFEQNTLLQNALQTLGFDVTGLAARVLLNIPDGVVLPRTHMLLRIDLAGGPVVADVGFGGLTPTAPLHLDTDAVQETPHEPFRLVRSGDEYRMQAQIGENWNTLYAFDLQTQHAADYRMMNHYTATHPDSNFRNNLMAARVAPGRRYGLRNDSLSVHVCGGETERTTLATADEIRAVLIDVFGLALPEDPELDGAFQVALAGTSRWTE